jgi:signal transduction histidine kinase/sensor domain CHASE-containing protein/CheY-like chemotaxis protein
MQSRRPAVASLVIFAFALALGLAAIRQHRRLATHDQREATGAVAASAALAIEQQLSRSLSATYALAAMLRHQGRIDDFDALAAEMLPFYGSISSLQLAPGGVVSSIHPLAGNEAALGHDLLAASDRRLEARLAVETRQLTLAGPFELVQGGRGVVGRLAVFLPSAAAPRGERFWGLVTVVVRMPQLLAAARLDRLEQAGYAWDLVRVDGAGGPEAIGAGPAPLAADPVSFPVKVPGGEWRLQVSPAGGWSGSRQAPAEYALVLAAAAAVAVLAFLFLRHPDLLRREVMARTAQLAEANTLLVSELASRQRAETALSLTQQVVERAVLAIAWADEDERLLYANEAFGIFLDRPRAEAVGLPIAEVVGALRNAWPDVRADLEQEGTTFRELAVARAAGERQVRFTLDRIQLGSRRVLALYARDVTDQRSAEDQLRQSQKLEAVGQLAGGIAHDFNNVLTGILANASLLEEELPPGSDSRESAAVIGGAARRAAELTRQLLGFARRGKLLVAPVDVHDVVGEVARLLVRTLDKRIVLVQRLRASRSVVLGDAGQLQQALLNLAVNARDAMPEGGVLTFETANVEADARWCERRPGAVAGPHVAIGVADSGHGIPRELQARIFEPFFTTKAPGAGTGMGLAMVYGMARNHGGVVEVESAPGSGARFTLYLPAAPEQSADADPGSAEAPRGAGLLLVVDDDPVPRTATARLLTRLGYEVAEAATGEEALRWYRRHGSRARAVVLDLSMPGMDGRECFRALRREDPAVRVILTSGYGPDGRAQQLVDEGVLEFLPKPFGAAELGAAVARAIGAPVRAPAAS